MITPSLYLREISEMLCSLRGAGKQENGEYQHGGGVCVVAVFVADW